MRQVTSASFYQCSASLPPTGAVPVSVQSGVEPGEQSGGPESSAESRDQRICTAGPDQHRRKPGVAHVDIHTKMRMKEKINHTSAHLRLRGEKSRSADHANTFIYCKFKNHYL